MVKISNFMLGAGLVVADTPGLPQTPMLKEPKVVLRPKYIPTEYTFGAAVGIVGVDGTKEITITFKIDDPNGNELVSLGPNVIPPNPAMVEQAPPEFRSGTFSMQFDNVNFSTMGIYKFRVMLNDEELEPQDIPVYPE